MIYRLIFNRASGEKKKNILQSKGVNIGCFPRDGSFAYVYILDNFFVEVFYKGNDSNNEIQKARTFTDYKKLEKYMEESFRQDL